MDISKNDLRKFIISLQKNYMLPVTLDNIVDLIRLIDECYEDKMMFDSWFRGIDVME